MQITEEARNRLRVIGWPDNAHWHEALAGADGARLARVVGQHRTAYDVATGPDELLKAQPPMPWTRPRFPTEQRAAVGDWVTLDESGKNILALLPRSSLLKRGAAGEHHRQQLIAANIDFVLVVVGLDQDYNPRRIERYLVLIKASGAQPVLVLTKADECDIVEDCIALLAEVEDAGVPIIAVNAKDKSTLAPLDRFLGPGCTVVLVGSSGAGKSTLTNTLLGREKMKTNEVRANDSRGRHTTTSRVLLPLPQGGCLIDTPGMREVKLSGDEDVVETFEDIEAIALNCRFRDCAHGNEPGCAVQAAIVDGTLDEARYLNFVKLRDEQEATQVTLAQRRAEEREANKALGKKPKDKYGRR